MDLGHTQTLKRFHVLFGGIALVPGQSIAGIVCIELNHLPVPCHLGDNGGSADGRIAGSITNDSLHLTVE